MVASKFLIKPNFNRIRVLQKLAPSELNIPEKSDTSNKPQPSEEVQVKAIDLGQATTARLP
jgi:hypothetical protein